MTAPFPSPASKKKIVRSRFNKKSDNLKRAYTTTEFWQDVCFYEQDFVIGDTKDLIR